MRRLVSVLLALSSFALTRAQTPRHDHDRIYLHSTATTNNLWVFDSCCDSQFPTEPKLNTISNILSSSASHSPSSLHVDREGYLWVVDYTNSVVSKFLAPPTSASTLLQFRIQLTPSYTGPFDLHFDANGDPHVLCNGGNKLIKIDHNNAAPAITEITYIPAAYGPPAYFCLHTSGVIYLQRPQNSGVITQLRKLGAQLVESFFWASPRNQGRGLSEGPKGDLWIAEYTYLSIVDQGGNTLTSVQCGNNVCIGHPIVIPTSSGIEDGFCTAWDGGGQYGIHQFRLQSGTVRWLWYFGYVSNGRNLTIDGRGRMWANDANGNVYWTNLARTAFGSLRYTTPTIPIGGDLTGIARALTIDKSYDDDGDSFMNIVEIMASSNPFDPSSTPTSDSPCILHVPTPTTLNSTVTLSLFGKPGNGYYVFTGTKLPASFKLPGFLGDLWLGPPIIDIFSSVYKPPFLSVIPPSGVVQSVLGIPNNSSLVGTYYFQGLTFPDPLALGFSNLAPLEIR